MADDISLLMEHMLFSDYQEESANVTANALHPGTMDTNFGKNNALFKYGVGI